MPDFNCALPVYPQVAGIVFYEGTSSYIP